MRRVCNMEKLTKSQYEILQSYIKLGLVKHYEFNSCDLLVYNRGIQEDLESIFYKMLNKVLQLY